MKIGTQLNHKQRVVNRYKDLFGTTKAFYFSQKEYLKRRHDIQTGNSYRRLTIYNREFMRGMEEMFFANLYRYDLIHCYDYQGKRYAIDTPEYKALNPCEVSENNTFHGHCWRKDLNKQY
jgi:hypothetical protein